MRNYEKFDMARKPVQQRWFLTPVAWLLSFPETLARKLKVEKIGMEGLKPPYLFISNHMAFVDFKSATRAIFPHGANYVVAIDGFLRGEELLRQVGCICKRKFTNDVLLLRHMKYALEVNRSILALYPEARYSYCGVDSVLPDSLGKLIKLFKVPVVTYIQRGNYLSQPVWNLEKRKCRIEATMTRLFTPEQIEASSVEEINTTLRATFKYNDYRWQRENRIAIDHPRRAKGLHHILYQCPSCLAESRMNSEGDALWCEACGKRWRMGVYGELSAEVGETEFSHIPDWFDFQRGMVRKEIEKGRYFFMDRVKVDLLPNAKGFVELGEATLTHSSKGFVLESSSPEEHFKLELPPSALYSLHIEFDYFGKGDCLDLSTIDSTFYLYPLSRKNVVCKLQFAVEELYKLRSTHGVRPRKLTSRVKE
ncbi:MAG: hypothetical protein FD137_39 [Spirochaetes bacterium]|nr:MAG: hypothetical protein FD137_39 [Spirochaetota bacterium]